MEYNVFQNNKLLDNLKDCKHWNLYNLLDILQDDTKNALKIKKEDYLLEGKNPIIDQGQLYIGGYTNRNDDLYKNVPSIIFGDHTRIIKYVDFPMFIGADGVKLLKSKLMSEELNIKYVYYFLKSVELPSDGYSRHFKYLKQIVIPVPIIITQKKIVEVLEKAEKVLEKRKESIKLLDELIKSKFIEMFGELKTNPNNFDIVELETLTTKITDGVHSKPDYTSEGIPFISVKDINRGKLDFSDCKFISKEAHENYIKRCKPEIGDILYTKVGATYGIPTIVDSDEEFSLYVSVALLKLKKGIINPVYIKEALRSTDVKRQADRQVKGIGVPDLHLIEIKKFNVFNPPIELQNQFADFVNQIDKLKFEMQKSLKEMENNFNSLMQKAFKGELFNKI